MSDGDIEEDVVPIPKYCYELAKTSLTGNSYWPRPSITQALSNIEMISDKYSSPIEREDCSDDEIDDPVQHPGEPYTEPCDILDMHAEDANRMSNFLKANYIRRFIDVSQFPICHFDNFLFQQKM